MHDEPLRQNTCLPSPIDYMALCGVTSEPPFNPPESDQSSALPLISRQSPRLVSSVFFGALRAPSPDLLIYNEYKFRVLSRIRGYIVRIISYTANKHGPH